MSGSSNEQVKRTIALVLYPGLTALDLIGPLQVLTVMQNLAPQYRVKVVGVRKEPMDTDVRVRLIPDSTFAETPSPFVLLVPGGRRATLKAMSDPAMRSYVSTAAETAEYVTSVCTGSLILASVNLLLGRNATTNWFYKGVLESYGARYVEKRWVESDKFIMSAGVSAGMDMGLYLVSRLTDVATARRVQREMDYDPKPPFGPIDWNHVGAVPRMLRGGISLAAPFLTAKPKRLMREEARHAGQEFGVGRHANN